MVQGRNVGVLEDIQEHVLACAHNSTHLCYESKQIHSGQGFPVVSSVHGNSFNQSGM
jgi:hypothetical protein